jgi:hypothetical protein
MIEEFIEFAQTHYIFEGVFEFPFLSPYSLVCLDSPFIYILNILIDTLMIRRLR